MLGSKVSPASAAPKLRYQRNRYVETARAETCGKVHFMDFEPPSVVPREFAATALASSPAARSMRCSICTPSVAATEGGKGVTIRYAPMDLRPTLSGSQSCRHLLGFEIRASPGAGGAGAAVGRRRQYRHIAGLGRPTAAPGQNLHLVGFGIGQQSGASALPRQRMAPVPETGERERGCRNSAPLPWRLGRD